MQFAASLTGGSFDEARMLQNVEACEWLTGALRGLQVPNLDPSYASMRAVCPISLSLLFGFFFFSDCNVSKVCGNARDDMDVNPCES